MAKFITIGERYHLGPMCHPYAGLVLVSADNLYLTVRVDQKDVTAGTYQHSHGVMKLVARGISMVPTPGLGAYEKQIDSLPDDVTSDPDWPNDLEHGTVFVVPRKSIDKMRYGVVSGLMFWAGGVRFAVEVFFKQRREIVAAMKSAGWPVDDRGPFQRLLGRAG